MRYLLVFSTAKASFGPRMVETLALLTPAADDPVVGEHGWVGVTGVLTAAVRMGPSPRRGSATAERHLPCVLHQGGLPLLGHRPAHDLARRQVYPHRQRPPARSRPDRGDSARPHVIGSRHVHLTRPQMRRHLLAGSAVGWHGTASPGTWHSHTRLGHHPPRLRAAPVKPGSLEWFGQATTTLTVTRCHGPRVDTGASGDLRSIDCRRGVSQQGRRQPAATDVEHLAEERHRPAVRRRGHKGLPQGDPLATSPKAFFQRSRSLRSRVWSSRNRGHASWSGDPRPFPRTAARCCAATAPCQRPSLGALSPRWRAVSDPPSPGSVTSRTASRVHSAP
jgi:hypothetical protein